MKIPIFEELFPEELLEAREQGRKQGEIMGVKKGILLLLDLKLEALTDNFRKEVMKIEDIAVLKGLMVEVSTATSIEQFIAKGKLFMGSPIYQEWVEVAGQEASEGVEAVVETIHEGMLYSLSLKFGVIPDSLTRNIKAVKDLTMLQGMQKKIRSACNIQALEEGLNNQV